MFWLMNVYNQAFINIQQQRYLIKNGIPVWRNGIVYSPENPGSRYAYEDYDACRQWLLSNWCVQQDERCLQALEMAGLVHKIDVDT